MAIFTDPICGMRVDPDDAVASAQREGQRYWFCSDLCRAAFDADPEPTADRLSEEVMARRSGTTVERIRRLVAAGVVEPEEDGSFARRDVLRARVTAYLAGMGIEAEDLGRGLESGHLTLGYIEDAGRQQPRSTMTHAEVGDEIGIPVETIQRLYVAFGLRRPAPNEPVREEDLPILRALAIMAEAGVGEDGLLRMARVLGESTRRIAQYLPHHFHTAFEVAFRQRGLGDNQAYEAAIRDVGVRVGHSGEDLIGWLFRRHSEVFMTAHQVDHVEAALENAGIRRRPLRRPEAAAFADVSGYTRLTEESGDEAAADVALRFAELVGEVATRHRGSIVKLLGDGAFLHFADPGDAVRASLDLADRAPAEGLPPTHIGVNAGPMLYDQGDYFGRTVNIAARIAAHAASGRVYVGESVVGVGREDGFTLREVGAFELKGIAEPMTLFQATRA